MDLFGNRKINRAFKLENKWARNIGANRSAPRDRPIALLVFARYTESYLTWQVRFDHRLQGIGQEILQACHASRENLQEINLSLPWAVETVKNHRWIVDYMACTIPSLSLSELYPWCRNHGENHLERTKLFPSPIDDRKKIVAIRGYILRGWIE